MTTSNQFLRSRLAAIDWDFVARSARKSPFSTFHWYPGQLISQIPATLIGLLSNIGDTVVDPFAGSGSVVTEAQRLGRRAVAMDINPIAMQIIAAKTLSCNATEFKRISSGIRAEIAPILGHDLASLQHCELAPTSPASVQLSKWYSASIGAHLTRLWSYCEAQIGERRVICDAVFSSILMAACRETRSWGYVCDNVQPKDEASGEDRDVFALVVASLVKLESGYVERQRSNEALGGGTAEFSAVQCITESALTAFDQLGKESASLVLTSPPYFGVHDYAKAQRLSMEWLGHNIEHVRVQEIGARSKRERNTGAADYLREMRQVFQASYGVLRPGGWLAVVIGESLSRASVIPEILQATESMGFSLAFQRTRQIGSDRAQVPVLKSERLFVWQK